MRYRRLSYSYTILFPSVQPSFHAGSWAMKLMAIAPPHTGWSPPVDVYETEDALNVTVELAGVDEEDVEVCLYDNALVIEGRRALPLVESNGVFHVMQIRQGPFHAEVPFSNPIDADRITATFDRGLLQVTLPRRRG